MLDLQISTAIEKKAIVIGGSIAGLLTAQVLTKYFDRVIIIERDRFPEQPEQRHGVPQAHHAHVLLIRGQQILEQLFPGIIAELTNSGTPTIDWAADSPWLGFSGWAPRFSSDLTSRACSRNLLEWTIRSRLAANNRIEFVQGGQVTSLLSNSNKTTITGVRVSFRNEPEAEILANLVIDACGRNSQTPQWLKELGYESPQQTVINSFLGYASRWYHPPEGFERDWKVLLVGSKPPKNTRSAVLYPVEGNRWIVTLIGVSRDYPPTDEAGFFDFAQSLRSPIIYEAIKDAQPVSPIYAYRRTENSLRHYEKLSRLPEGLIIVGDAVCAFNPVYGQGMTTAALGALTLDECLSKQLSKQFNGNLIGLPRYFQKQLSKTISVPWLMATGEDFRWPSTEGGKPDLISKLTQRYLDQVLLLQTDSAEIQQLILEVMNLLKPPSAFFQPGILMQVLKRIINSRHQSDELIDGENIPKYQPLVIRNS
ncbi:FAD-dependent monooxygenase [Desmonostoc muscorum LEGE 12446]|uniref:FAD-dependent monooxygenase n=1 Tax=Desmonostoc muscorum LEGE 12446 TaxID=1828758 RepID=A0A8J7DF12_DESMC|nr:FAD-dependent monooxygenase [Desmonostoc muscorum]MCF2146417.1 FAD-dependent monooxygenase [Desmonostoc muscorum LEGE 12446]